MTTGRGTGVVPVASCDRELVDVPVVSSSRQGGEEVHKYCRDVE